MADSNGKPLKQGASAQLALWARLGCPADGTFPVGAVRDRPDWVESCH